MDSYQPIYDAVRSRISGFDSQTLYDAISRQFDISHSVEMVRNDLLSVAYEHQRPCVLFRPKLTIDGDQWCALYGKDIQDGVAGHGNTPAEAMADFDKNWNNFSAKREASNGN